MREILFRGKRLDNGEWVEGSLISFGGGEKVIFPSKSKVYMPVGKNVFCSADCYDVDPNTVGQFTGLLDKNGQRIFEGDVIQFHIYRGEPDWIGVVKYEHCLYMAVGTMPLAYEKRIGEEPYFCPFKVQISGIDKATIKVVGNIHDNPELLRGGCADG